MPSLNINETFTMRWFSKFALELPPFANYLNYIYIDKYQYSVVRDSERYLPNQWLHSKLFNLVEPSNIEIDFIIEGQGSALTKALLSELLDKRKATRNYLSSAGECYSWVNVTERKS